uniref:Uncharacterized protein n=1 Tax=Setaria viridis TaxID=4556 RepID=A0A4U6UJD8_SETVI|nr:hypothetical protein SEVIR_5G246600v2 [Setaria viridis]
MTARCTREAAACRVPAFPPVLAARSFLPKPASVHARGPAGRPSVHGMGGHHAWTCALPGSHGNGHGRKRRTCPHLGRRTPTAATGLTPPGPPRSHAKGNRAQPRSASLRPPLLIQSSVHPPAINRPPPPAPSSPPFHIGSGALARFWLHRP